MKRLLLGSLFSALLLSSAYAQGFSVTITLDENGKGTFTNTSGFFAPLPGVLLPDRGPGGLAAALTYSTLHPPGLVAGDLLLAEPGVAGVLSDLIRFNPNENGGSVVFYWDTADGGVDLADTGFPTALYANRLTVTEIGPEGANGFSYTPIAGQPGFVAGAGGPVTYVLKSDVVPEPSSILLLVTVVGILSYRFASHRRHA